MKKNHEIFQIFRTLTFAKLINLTILRLSYFLSLLLKKDLYLGHPAYYSIEPTNCCNLHCVECPVIRDEVNFPSGFMNYDDFKEIIKRIKKVSIYINLYLRGELFLNPQIFSMIKNLYE